MRSSRPTLWTALLSAAALAASASAYAGDKDKEKDAEKPEKEATAYNGPKAASPGKLAFIDLEKITNKYAAYKSAKADFEGKQEEAKKRVKAIDEKIKKKEDDYKAKENILKDDAKKKMQDDYQKLLEERQNMVRSVSEQLMQMDREATQQLQTEIKSTVKAIAVQKGYELIVEKSTAIYGSDDLGLRFGDDITDDVVKILNKK